MQHLVTFSGGKDSQATIIWAINNLKEDFKIIFCDTGWESAETYRFMLDFEAQLQLPVHYLKAKRYQGFIDMVQQKKRFPSVHNRFCTDELKIKPMIDFILDEVQDDIVVYQGIRHEESRNRAKMERYDDYFKGYFEPYKITDLQTEYKKLHLQLTEGQNRINPPKLAKIAARLDKIKAKLDRGVLTEESTYSYRKSDVVKFCEKYDAQVVRPIITWTTQEVFDYINANGFEYNPLYKKKAKRVGCYPCVMCGHEEILEISKQDPERIEEIRQQEKSLKTSFFPSGYIPEKYCSMAVSSSNTDSGVKCVPTIDDVLDYVEQKGTDGLPSLTCRNPFTPCE